MKDTPFHAHPTEAPQDVQTEMQSRRMASQTEMEAVTENRGGFTCVSFSELSPNERQREAGR